LLHLASTDYTYLFIKSTDSNYSRDSGGEGLRKSKDASVDRVSKGKEKKEILRLPFDSGHSREYVERASE